MINSCSSVYYVVFQVLKGKFFGWKKKNLDGSVSDWLNYFLFRCYLYI